MAESTPKPTMDVVEVESLLTSSHLLRDMPNVPNIREAVMLRLTQIDSELEAELHPEIVEAREKAEEEKKKAEEEAKKQAEERAEQEKAAKEKAKEPAYA